MAKNQFTDRPQSQTQTDPERSLSRRESFPFPNFGGELFSMSPFALLREMTNWMDRSFGPGSGQTGGGRQNALWSPAVEVSHHDNNLTVRADLPGIEPNDVKVEVDNDTLVIQGERKQEHNEERQGWHRSERVYGSFYRAIPLPEGTRCEQAKADFKNGVLEIKIPCEQAKSSRRQIPIQGAGSGTSHSTSSASSGAPPQTGTSQGGTVQR